MQTVVIDPLVNQEIDQLFDVLLQENYFFDQENAWEYCNKIRAFIKTLPEQKHYFTKNKFWGVYYAVYKPNKRTTWFITFDEVIGKGYLVHNIFNNHTEEYPLFIR